MSEDAYERGERVGRDLELNDCAIYLESWAEKGPPGWRNAARCFAHHIRHGLHRNEAQNPGDAIDKARREAMQWQPISGIPKEHQHGAWVRVWVEAGALYAPNNGPATHYLLFPTTPQSPGDAEAQEGAEE